MQNNLGLLIVANTHVELRGILQSDSTYKITQSFHVHCRTWNYYMWAKVCAIASNLEYFCTV